MTIYDVCTDAEWDRFQKYIEYDTNTGCWLWSGGTASGYGSFRLNNPRRVRGAHRITYTKLVGQIPDGLEPDHLCRTRPCCNPAHLEPVTTKENLSRSPFFGANRTHCPKGHEYTPENTIFQVSNGKYRTRACRLCRAEADRSTYQADPAAGAARRKANYDANPESQARKRAYMREYNRRKREAQKA